MSKNNFVTCLRFEEKVIYIAVIDPDSAEVKWSDALEIPFPIINSSGVLTEPGRLGNFLKSFFNDNKLPQTIKLSIGLKYIDIKQFHLPTMPENELEPVIIDEASRESIFSFSGGNIAIAYQILSDTPRRLANELKLNVLASTIPKDVIDSYVSMFKNTGLKLIAIQPDLAGFRQILGTKTGEPDEDLLMLRVTSGDAELFIWEKTFPMFWRYLSIGSQEPERLVREIETTLEHVESKTGQPLKTLKILFAGQPLPGLAEYGSKPEMSPVGEWSDLLGIGQLPVDQRDLNFVPPAATGTNYTQRIPQTVYWAIIAFLTLFNCWRGWMLNDYWLNYQKLFHKNITLRQILENGKNQMQLLQKKESTTSSSLSNQKMPALLETLRAFTPTDIRFESVEYDRDNQTLTIAGVSLTSGSLHRFIGILTGMDGVLSVDEFQSALQNQPDLNINSFHVKVTLKETKS